jgi:hypothetical protein
MKIDVEITLKTDKLSEFSFNENSTMTVAVDQDYCEDYDEVLAAVEEFIWNTYGKSLHFGVDFEPTEAGDYAICDAFNCFAD